MAEGFPCCSGSPLRHAERRSRLVGTAAALLLCLALAGGCGKCTSSAPSAGSVAKVDDAAAVRQDPAVPLLPFTPLPASVVRVQSSTTQGFFPEAIWSRLGHAICKSSFRPFQELAVRRASAGSAFGIDPDTREEVRLGLRCGRFVTEHRSESPWIYIIHTSEEPIASLVMAVGTNLRHLSDLESYLRGFHRTNVNGYEALCWPFDEHAGPCEGENERDRLIVLFRGYLVQGRYPSVLRLLSSSGTTTDLDALVESLAEYHSVELDRILPGTRWMIGRARWLPFSTESGTVAVADAVRTKAAAIAFGSSGDGGAILIQPRSDADSESLLEALRSYHHQWSEEVVERMTGAMAEEPDDCLRELEARRVQAIRAATVRRRDRQVELRFQLSNAPAEPPKPDCDPMRIDAASARLVRAFVDGRALPRSDVLFIGGARLAEGLSKKGISIAPR